MKRKIVIVTAITICGLFVFSCVSTGYNTQQGAAIGAGLGAIAGQAIGRNTASTLIGAAIGGLYGSIVGNAVDQNMGRQRDRNCYNRKSDMYRSYKGNRQAPSGGWTVIPDQRPDDSWVPNIQAQAPINL